MTAQAYIAAKQRADTAAGELEQAWRQFTGLAKHTSESGGSVRVTRYWKAGTIDYKQIPELRGVELARYRAPPREQIRGMVGVKP